MRSAHERRKEFFQSNLRSRASAYSLALGCSAAFLVGAWRRDPLIMLGGPVFVALVVAGVAYYLAERRAEDLFYLHFATTRGLNHWPNYTVLPYTPLLAAGDRQRFEHWIEGRLSEDPPLVGGFGRFIYERVQRDGEGDPVSTTEAKRLTVGVLDLQSSIARYKGVFLRPRRGLFDLGEDWLGKTRSREIELESTNFTERYELRIAADQDEVEARRLFTPSLINWLAAHPLTPGLELKAGVLVIFAQRVLDDDGNLTFFLDAMRHLGARVLAEASEAAAA